MVRLMSEFQSTATGAGTVGYVTVNPTATYATSSILKLDMVTFSGTTASGDVNIVTDPTSQVVAVGQPASFSVRRRRRDNAPLPINGARTARR